MTVDFVSPSFRASANDLTIAISPLGLVELADEEFEVHGPRLNRYANYWAFYLGMHWSIRRPTGEPQLTFNYTAAFSDFITNFVFGRGVTFRSPNETSAIIPPLLQRVWEVDNNKEILLWEMGNMGSVSGDVFVKVAYEEPHYQPPIVPGQQPIPGIRPRYIPGKVRILPLNPSFCFPEWHPHDRNRMLRMKMKYKFWGTTPEGTRSIFTYTELITDVAIEEYINDQLMSSRPNPLGEIPVVHIPNKMVASSPWGKSDIEPILLINREYNEKATDVSDILNYHAAPVTIMSGAKQSQLEKGATKVWAVPEKAKVYNLENSGQGIEQGLSYLEMLKKAMHELTGVPEGALGDVQPISNTSGVALAIQYQPMMNTYNQKKMTYGQGIQDVNKFVLLTLALKEPLEFQWTPDNDEELKEGQLNVLDFDDPITYMSVVHWPPPLPVDILVKLNEVQLKMGLGLMSKRQALMELGEEFPDEKAREIFLELVADAIDQGALDMLKAQISQGVQSETGQFMPGGPQPFPPPAAGMPSGGGVSSAGGSDVNSSGAPAMGPPPLTPQTQDLLNQINTRAYGTKLAQRRVPPPGTEDD